MTRAPRSSPTSRRRSPPPVAPSRATRPGAGVRPPIRINHQGEADYHLLQFTGPPALLESLSHTLRIADEVLRFRIIKVVPGTPEAPDSAPPILAGSPAPARQAPATPRAKRPNAVSAGAPRPRTWRCFVLLVVGRLVRLARSPGAVRHRRLSRGCSRLLRMCAALRARGRRPATLVGGVVPSSRPAVRSRRRVHGALQRICAIFRRRGRLPPGACLDSTQASRNVRKEPAMAGATSTG